MFQSKVKSTIIPSSPTEWERAEEYIKSLSPQNPEDFQIRPDLIQSALDLLPKLQKEVKAAPKDVYTLSDGNIILEWQFPCGTIIRVEIEEVGKAEVMYSYPAEFETIKW